MTSSPAPNAGADLGPTRVLFVCMGNICRSPTAEAVLRHHVSAHGLDELIEIDSAGTGGWHAGDEPDERARAEASRRGIEMTGAARKVHLGDFEYFDLIVAMDESNMADLSDLAASDQHRQKIRLLREFGPDGADDLDVPDPYFGGVDGFADVFDLVDESCRGLLEHLRADHQ